MPRYFNIGFVWAPLGLIVLVILDFTLTPQHRMDPAIWIQASCAFGLSIGMLLTTWAHRSISRSAQRAAKSGGQANGTGGLVLGQQPQF